MARSGPARRKGSGKHSFTVVETGINRERSSFNRDSRHLTTIDSAYLYPLFLDEVLPGDTFQVRAQIKGWLATPLLPFLDNLYLDTFYFFVPNRLVWDNWKYFQGEKVDPSDTTTYQVPQIMVGSGDPDDMSNRLETYFGLPGKMHDFEVNAMPFRDYNLIYNEFFRDQFLQDSVDEDKGDANSLIADHVLLKRGKRKDYINGCLPFAQAGPDVTINLGTSAPVITAGDGKPEFTIDGTDEYRLRTAEAGQTKHTIFTDGIAVPSADSDATWYDTKLQADLTAATASTVNQLRERIAIQQVLELDARAGRRLNEQIQARFGVTPPDYRLQRPEYLGGSSQNISVTPVPNTSAANSGTVGTLHGFGHVNGSGGGFTQSFTEHGFVMMLANIRADYTYFEGIERHWRRLDRYDYYEPAFAHLGEQEVLNSEVVVSGLSGGSATDDLTFGYQERFAEYKYGKNIVSGLMAPSVTGNIAQWHLAEYFNTLPTLGAAFIVDNPPVDRVIAVPSEPQLIIDVAFANRCTRVMPVFNTPGLRRL